MGNSVIFPLGLMRPIWLPSYSVNQRLPSGPAVILSGELPDVGRRNSVIFPLGVMRPIWLTLFSVNQRLPSGPAVIPSGPLAYVGIVNSVSFPASRTELMVGVGWRVTVD